ncbi:hypothetical protein DMC47_01685 [Nostoc sp. 3335mG]|nr:hypothetical protein DMC47_01685 [Nostoc sp. 3335mG]
MLALGALALLSAVLLPAEFDYQDAYDGAGASRRLMLGIFGGVVFIGGVILVAAQSILDGLRRAPAPSQTATPALDPFAYREPLAVRSADRAAPVSPAALRRDRSGNSLLIGVVTIIGLAAILVIITLAILMLRDERQVAGYGNILVEANSAIVDPDPSIVGSQLWAPGNDATTLDDGPEPTLPAVSEENGGLDKMVPGLDRLPVRRAEPETEPPATQPREAPARRAAPDTREDPFADPPAANDDPFAD